MFTQSWQATTAALIPFSYLTPLIDRDAQPEVESCPQARRDGFRIIEGC